LGNKGVTGGERQKPPVPQALSSCLVYLVI
jgi:hypothetical protein